jgi:hypothetical protein
MNTFRSIALGSLVPLGFAVALRVHVEPDQLNVSADRLSGVWVTDAVVSGRMGLTAGQESLEFRKDESFLTSIPESLSNQLQQERIYESGILVSRKDGAFEFSAPYLLTSKSGNPHLPLLHESGGVPLAGVKSANVFVAPGRERHQDLLLLGGDTDDTAFRPFRRSRTEGELSNN